jgi:peptidyl-prolyl cis-trans isomerase SurA
MKLFKLAAGALVCATFGLAADVQTVDEIIAKVNGDIVSRNELERTAKEMVAELRAQNLSGQRLEDEYNSHQKDILRNKIDSLLLVQRGKELNIDVTSELNKYLADLQRRSTIADPEKFREYIHQQTGMSWEDFQSEAKNNIMTRRVISEEVSRNVSVSATEVQAYYEAHKKDFIRQEKVYLQEILVSTEGKDASGIAAAEKKAKDLSARAAKGERFADLARDNSDSTTAQQGGDLGSGYGKGDLVKSLEDAVWNLPKGGVTPPIKVPSGFLVLKVTQHTKEGQAELADVQPQIEEILYEPKMEPKIREYLTGLRKTAFLEIKDGYVDTGACPGCDTRWQDVAVLRPETTSKVAVSQRIQHKRLLFLIPIPGTSKTVTGKSSSR